jgi:Fe-S cluster biogenesis protein NfuA
MNPEAKVPVSIYAEMTPNPAVMKFVANKRLIDLDSVEYKNIEEAATSPLATRLFHYPFVKEVFISGNYLAISKYNVIEWEEVTQELRALIRDWVANGKEVVNTAAAQAAEVPEAATFADDGTPEPDGEIERRIREILEEYIRPAVAQDGGNIKLMGFEDKTVKVLLQGACSGCPSSTLTLKNGIENLLKQMLPTLVERVEAVNG